MKIGLALEGGGARGAYEIGAVKLLVERKYKITAVVGTSIGAVNAVMIAQDKFDEAYKIWEELSYSKLFDLDDDKLKKDSKKKIDINIVKYLSSKITEAVKTGGINTDKMKEFISSNIDEEKIRNGKILFGLVTYCLTDRKSRELFIDDIPEGKLAEYIMASGSLPGFKKTVIDGKTYIDGGVENNCPISMLIEKGYKNIIAISTGSIFKVKNIKEIMSRKDLNIIYIKPKEKLPNILSFDSATSNELLKLGYYDAIKVLDKLEGYDYYIRFKKDEKDVFKAFTNLDIKIISDMYKIMGKKENDFNSKKMFFENILPNISKKINVTENNTYKELLISIIEYICIKENIEKFKVYEYKELIELIKNKMKTKNSKKTKIEQIMYLIIKNIDI